MSSVAILYTEHFQTARYVTKLRAWFGSLDESFGCARIGVCVMRLHEMIGVRTESYVYLPPNVVVSM